jgi:hypothetical protein
MGCTVSEKSVLLGGAHNAECKAEPAYKGVRMLA